MSTLPSIVPETAALDDVLITDQLARRPWRAPDHEGENRTLLWALRETSIKHADQVFHALPERMLELCRAESAGISILNEEEEHFRWDAVAGELKRHVGQTIPRVACPCTVAIARNNTVLMHDPERHFTVLRILQPRVAEAMLEPFMVDGKVIGTVWVVQHQSDRHFDAEDARLLHSLAVLAASAWQASHCLVMAGANNGELEQMVAERTRHLSEGNAVLKREIEQRFQAEAALRESEARLSAVFESLPVGVGVFNNDGRLLLSNREMQRYLPNGVMPSADPERGWRWTAVQADGTPVDRRQYPMARALRGERVVPGLEMCYQRDDGSMLWTQFASVPVFNAAGHVSAEVGVVTDITALKEATAALRESESLFRTLAEAAPAFVWRIDPQGNAAWVNRRNCEDTGFTLEELLGTGWHAMLHPDDGKGFVKLMQRAIESETPARSKIRLRQREGGWRWYDVSSAPLFTDDGEYLGHVGLSIDIDASVKAQEVLQEADRRKDVFLATLAHELRNPLAPITNAVSLLRNPEGRRAADRMLDMVDRQVHHLVRLVDDLMEVSRITRGKIGLVREPVPLAEILDSAVETSEPLIRRTSHSLTVSMPPEAIMLDADKLRLTQVFANLLNNAAKFTPPGGHIWLRAQVEEGMAKVSVRDDGIGIAADKLSHVFDMFLQVRTTAGPHNSGLGIGLTMVRKLVEMHGGTVRAESEGVGKGSEFTVCLPILAFNAPPDLEQVHAPQGEARLAGRRLLVVDDNHDAADTLGLLLTAAGADTTVVYSAQEALAALEQVQPDAVMLDIGMPGMDGHELARRIRQINAFKDMPIIAVSGWGQAADRELSRASGIDHHLTKPVNFGVLEELLLAQ